MKIARLVLAATFALAAVPMTAHAEDPPKRGEDGDHKGGHGGHRGERRGQLDGGAGRSGDAGAGREVREEMRKARKAARVAELKAKYGDSLDVPAVKEELRTNASRMARLRRVENLARQEKKDAIVKRVEAVMDKEKARHEKRMSELKSAAGDAGSAKPATMDGGGK